MNRIKIHIANLLLVCLSLPAIAVEYGTFQGDLKDESGQYMRYQATVPQSQKKQLGLIVGLHGINGHERQLTGSLNKALAACKLQNDYMVLCLKSKGNGWENVDHEPILKSIQWAIDTYNIDRRRIFGWGYSHGGFRYGVLGAQAQDVFAGVAILGGGMQKPSAQLRTLHYYLIHGSDDKTVNVSAAHRSLEFLKQFEYPYVYRELTAEGHGVAGSRKSFASRCDALRYFNRLRNPNVAVEGVQADYLKKAKEALSAKRISAKKVFTALPLIGGKETDEIITAVAETEDYKLLQAAAMTAQHYQYNDAVAQLLGRLLTHKKSKVKETALIALVQAAQWNQDQALQELIRFINNDDIKDSERSVAIQQLGLSIPLQLTCNNVQQPLFSCLIECLDHDSARLRTAAITALMGASGGQAENAKGAAEQLSESPRGGFGYHPKASDEKRAASIERWKKWLASKS